ncbi:hypothetical protein RN001_004396 [Aquatica leii]|uniref:Mitochondrial ribosomal protein L1 n=1 Tax=Aquatica leii TaxID=1421715 RepID=A0AAN7PZW3_9COLE|nr:hypothetical protein RN001_004396 [Aquatica leii]
MLLLNRIQLILPIFSDGFVLQSRHPILLRNYAARKGTRERKAKKKVKVEVEKVGFIPHNQRNKEKMLLNRPKRKFNDSMLKTPDDDVYIAKYYRWKIYPFSEAIECHRETHHPDMYNKPQANVCINIELNMLGEKKTRFVDNFTRIAPISHKFNHGEERSILVFTKEVVMQDEARSAGAQLAGGIELIKEIQNGNLSLQDFDFIVAHPNILPELVALRGLMKRKFPNPKTGTLELDIPSVVDKFVNGINYSAIKDEYEKDFALIETVIGTLDMNEKHLEENYASLIRDVYKMKPKRSGTFITRCVMLSPPSREKLMIDYSSYVSEVANKEAESDDEDKEVKSMSN